MGIASADVWDSHLPQSVREAWRSMCEGGGALGLLQTQALAMAAGPPVLLYAGMLSSLVSSGSCQQHELLVSEQKVMRIMCEVGGAALMLPH